MKADCFEDLIAWQKARALTAQIYAATTDGSFARDFALRDQIRRASVSIMANLAEGFDRHGLNEFHRFLTIAKALTSGWGIFSSPILKFRRERSVCAPQYRSAATSMGPKESDSMRVGVAACGL